MVKKQLKSYYTFDYVELKTSNDNENFECIFLNTVYIGYYIIALVFK